MLIFGSLQQEILQADRNPLVSRFMDRLWDKLQSRERLHDTFVAKERIHFLESSMTLLVFAEASLDIGKLGILADMVCPQFLETF